MLYRQIQNYDPLISVWLFVTPGTLFEQTGISSSLGWSMLNIVPFGEAVLEKKIF